jgi:hypothetical protein
MKTFPGLATVVALYALCLATFMVSIGASRTGVPHVRTAGTLLFPVAPRVCAWDDLHAAFVGGWYSFGEYNAAFWGFVVVWVAGISSLISHRGIQVKLSVLAFLVYFDLWLPTRHALRLISHSSQPGSHWTFPWPVAWSIGILLAWQVTVRVPARRRAVFRAAIFLAVCHLALVVAMYEPPPFAPRKLWRSPDAVDVVIINAAQQMLMACAVLFLAAPVRPNGKVPFAHSVAEDTIRH